VNGGSAGTVEVTVRCDYDGVDVVGGCGPGLGMVHRIRKNRATPSNMIAEMTIAVRIHAWEPSVTVPTCAAATDPVTHSTTAEMATSHKPHST
jgi:hypothetical protein